MIPYFPQPVLHLGPLEIHAFGALVVVAATLASISEQRADIVFLDPPYEQESEYAPALRLLNESAPRLVVVQHSVRFMLAESYGALQRTRTLKQGDNALSFYTSR